MKIYDIEQGSQQWYSARSGIPTSSEFSNIITPVTGKLSKSADEYADRLVAEIYMKEAIQSDYVSYDMERGKILEQKAADAYEQVTGIKTKIAGFVTDDSGKYGCSPDRFVGDKGLVEIKCMLPQKHMGFLLKQEISKIHKPQIQGQLLICQDRDWVDWWVYHPQLPAVRVRNYRDDEYIKKLENALERFWDILLNKLDTLKAMGYMDSEPEQTIIAAG